MSVSVGAKRRRRRSGAVSAAVLSIVALVLTGFALRYPGLSSSDVEVSDGGVWVMSKQDGLMGRLNVDARELDARLTQIGDDLDLLQSGYTVFETGARGMTPINTTGISRGGVVELPPETVIALGGTQEETRVAIAAADGRVWILTPAEAAAFSPGSVDPTYESKAQSPQVTVTTSGTVFVLDGENLLRFAVTPDTRDTTPDKPIIVGNVTTKAEELELTAVGEEPVILDRENGLLRIGADATDYDLAADGVSNVEAVRLQQPSPSSDGVVLATEDSLLRVPLGRGETVVVPAGGTGAPVAPAQAGGCAYGAWNGSLTYVRACAGAEAVAEPVPDADSSADLRLRVNHDLVVLNDQEFGLSWMISDDMQVVDDWQITQEIQTNSSKDKEKETLTTTITNIAAERDQENRPPTANDDEFGVRPGQAVVLPVTRNDTDPDGDLLTVKVQGEQPGIGTVTPIRGGTQMQIVVNDDATGSATFTYLADDGRGGTDTATVSLDVRSDDENAAPRPAVQEITKVQVRAGQEVSFNILPYWEDPDGDAFYLTNATVPPEDIVSFRADGLITFNDAGLVTGTKEVQLTFRDEKGMVAEGTLEVEAVSDTDLAPITTSDHASVVAGRSTTIKPLVNDLNPNGGDLELTHVSQSDGLEVDAVLEAGTINVRGAEPGTHYLDYTVAATGASSASTGLIRVDITEPTSENQVPVAVDDMGTVTTGTDTLIDPLENDVDPTGGLLVVNSVEAPPGSGLKATVVSHHLVRVEAAPNAVVGSEPVPLTYEVANSAGKTTGTIRVMLVHTDTQFANPVAVPDQATVRAGDMVLVDVLANDISPTDSSMNLGALSNLEDAEALGHAEPHQDQIRFSADDDASGETSLTYEVIDETGRTGSARLNITIIPREASNAPPRPENLTARTVAGTPVRIPVPTTGIDPDGDSVMLTGIASPAPKLGEVTKATGEWIEYVPHEGSVGTDRFRYQVMDRHGAVGAGEVLVGIALPHDMNQAPFAIDDIVEVKPDREVQIPVLDNDTDPEGTPLQVVRADVEAMTDIEVLDDERSADGVVTVMTPSTPGTHSVLYSASDGQLKSSATITIKVDPNAPDRNPVARDDFVEAAQVMDPEGESIKVDILANDSDPDGSVNDLVAELENAPEGTSIDADNIVSVTPQDEQQRIRYTITDIDGLSSAGYIWVPGRAKQAPVWVGGTVTAQSDTDSVIDLGDPSNVRVRPGAQPARVTDPSRVQADHNDGSELVQDASTLVYRPAEGFSGQDTLTVEVSDGEAGDPTSATATLAIPVEVVAEEEVNLPPTLQGAQLNVEQGGTQSSVDLAVSAEDPEGDELTFSLGEVPQTEGLTIGIEGSAVTAQATAKVAKGTVADVPVAVTDGTNDPVTATVRITVGGSNKPMITTILDTAQIDAGDTGTVPVLENDSNPFPGGERTIVSSSLTAGEGTVETEGENLVISPDPEFHGILTAQYTVSDDTGDPDRHVSGTVRVTVRGKPDAPSAPRIGEVGNGMVELNFTAGADNGAPITAYEVSSASGPAVSQSCASTSCTITGLSNDTEYTFQVTATNEVGTSEPSVASSVARPDVRPEKPGAPSAERGDQQLTVTWSAPVNNGSAIQRYELQLQNSASGELATRNVDPGSTQLVWDSLTNGTDYRFRVRAHNLAEEPSDWSEWSVSEHPAGRPLKPAGAITAERINDPLGGGIKVTWPAMTTAEANGEAIRQYVVQSSSGKTATIPATGASLTHTFYGLDRDSEHSFTYIGVNSVGRGVAASDRSNAVIPWAVPQAPADVRASLPSDGGDKGPNGRAVVSWTAADDRGTAIKDYVITWSGGSVTVPASQRSHVVTGLTNGKAYTFKVQARNRFEGGESALSAASNAVTPYTKPSGAGISSDNQKCTSATDCKVTFSLTANGSDGGAGGKTLQYRVDGGAWQDAPGTSHTVTKAVKSEASMTVEARVVNAKGLASATSTRTQKAQKYIPPLKPRIVNGRSVGNASNQSGCKNGSCYFIDFTVTGLQPNTTYTYCVKADGPIGGGCWYPTTDGRTPTTGKLTTNSRGEWTLAGDGRAPYWGYPYVNMWIWVERDGRSADSNKVQIHWG